MLGFLRWENRVGGWVFVTFCPAMPDPMVGMSGIHGLDNLYGFADVTPPNPM
jgi:hypothetical protein